MKGTGRASLFAAGVFAMGAAAAGSATAQATGVRPGMDCPLALEAYSTRSPLLDLLIDPAARSVLEREAPALLKVPFGPAAEWPTTPPSFAAILSPAALLAMTPDSGVKAAALDAALARVKLEPAAIRARCARYDSKPPVLPVAIARPAVLVFDKINGFRDSPSVDAAAAALEGIAKRRGWTIVSTANGAVFNARDLARFDVVVWNNISGDALTLPQRAAFQAWLRKGGGFAGIHGSGGDPVYFWDWYADELLGARFKGHPMRPQFQEARVVVEGAAAGVTAGLGPEWRMTEEWYSFGTNPRTSGAHVLATLDESTYSPEGMGGSELRMGDHPIAWTRCIGNGRSFYTAIGHRPESYVEPHSLQLLEQGIAWAAGLGDTRCVAGSERPAR
jgi:type 1 glutamine amidotransferase